MSNTIIRVEDVSKQYRLGIVGTGTLSHDLNRTWHRLRGKEDPYLKIGEENDRTKKGDSDYVWALKDVNFDVYQGEVLGIIGRNGAGKSTLLKILSRTTAPTTGSIKIKGRIASLLEVGTGFHPELSGRDNIFLNGAILGMTKAEIEKKFDEIVDFSGVERYIDTPVKRYSSGMYVRLAFAVAAHLEPEILIIDEVLAVGDTEFQKKCLGKMKDVSEREGRTVLFVSHQMGTISQLCDRVLFMEHGKTKEIGFTKTIVENYLSETSVASIVNYSFDNNDKVKKNYFTTINTESDKGVVTDQFGFHQQINLFVALKLEDYDPNILFSVTIQDKHGYYISTHVYSISELPGEKEYKQFTVSLPPNIMAPNTYSFRCALFKKDHSVFDLIESAATFKVVDTGSKMSEFEGSNYGQVILDFKVSPHV